MHRVADMVRWVLVGSGGFWWVLVGSGGFWWVLVGSGGFDVEIWVDSVLTSCSLSAPNSATKKGHPCEE